ncbi:MAG: radical SAM protein, partial [Alphaproteobacteria bacterium]|nr:radical SAM protein [Alphaproteobacteria bacterium]
AAKRPLLGIPGLAFQEGNQVVINPRRPLIADIDSIAWPAYGRFPIDYYRLVRMPRVVDEDFVMPLMSGRGCTFRCTFCYRMDPGYRPRDPDDIVEEIRYLKRDFGITFISFQDDLLMASVEQTEAICQALLKADLGITWNCNGRLNYTTPQLLRLMRDAGCVYINYGIESLDEEVLKGMKKGLRPEMVVKGVEATLEVGISPGLNMIFGSIGDTPETLGQAVDFLLKYDDCCEIRTIRPVTPYPGSPLYYDAIEKGLLAGPEDFYENKHLNADLLAVNFTELSDDEFYACLQDANRRLLENYHRHQRQASLDQVAELYQTRDTSFRGFRPV